MKILILLIILTLSVNGYSQSAETLAAKISSQICDCVGKLKNYSELKSKLDTCHDQAMNNVFINANEAEIAILGDVDKLKSIKSGLEFHIKSTCSLIKSLINKELKETTESAVNKKQNSFPTNFSGKDIKKIKRWEGRVIAFDAEIGRVEKSRRNTPYYQVSLGSKTLWVASMIDSGYERVGNKVRVVGYSMLISKDEYERKFHNDDFHVLVFGLVDLTSKQLAYFPGSEQQMKEWMNGKIPSEGK